MNKMYYHKRIESVKNCYFFFRWDRLSVIAVSVHVQLDGNFAIFGSFTSAILFIGKNKLHFTLAHFRVKHIMSPRPPPNRSRLGVKCFD